MPTASAVADVPVAQVSLVAAVAVVVAGVCGGGWYAGTGACVQVGNVLSWSSGLWDHPGELSWFFWIVVFLSVWVIYTTSA